MQTKGFKKFIYHIFRMILQKTFEYLYSLPNNRMHLNLILHQDWMYFRFLLRRIDDVSMLVPSQPSSTSAALNSGNSGGSGNPNDNDNGSQNSGGTGNGPEFKRKLSKREKKELKKQEKLQKQKAKENKGDESVADQLYTGRISCYFC